MGKRDVRERKCGCLVFKFGPPVPCGKHAKKAVVKEAKALRFLFERQLNEMDHELTEWSEYINCPGKWTAHCIHCGVIAVCYEKMPPKDTDQMHSWGLKKKCARKESSIG